MKNKGMLNIRIFLNLIMIMVFTLGCSPKSIAADSTKIVVDGKDITSLARPVFENDRTLVPVRFIAEAVGAEVSWNDIEKKVILEKGDTSVVLKIDSHLVQYKSEEGTSYGLNDVAPKIIKEHTYIPVRLVSNALGIGIEWDNVNRIVSVDSSKGSNIEAFFDMKIKSVEEGQDIKGKTDLQISLNGMDTKGVKEIKYLLLDPNTAQGTVVGRGTELEDKYIWLPNLEDTGEKVLVAALYDAKGKFIAGDVVGVNMKVTPEVKLTGIQNNEIAEEQVLLMPDINFVASYVKYEITNLDKDIVTITEEQDPQGEYKWSPMVEDNGNYSFRVIAFDAEDNPYESEIINAEVQLPKKLSLNGVSAEENIDKPVTLLASRNFNVSETQYILRDSITKTEEIIANLPYGGYTWFPGPEHKGAKEVFVRVKDTKGISHESDKIKVNLTGNPKLLIQGVGPKQVITEAVSLKTNSNVDIEKVDYIAINSQTKKEKVLGKNINSKEDYILKPEVLGDGNWNIKAQGKYNGKKISSEIVSVRVYLGKIYGKQSVIEKDKFLEVASKLAKSAGKESGLSPALQTAQSILETGWGQSVGVDKYSGKLSYNLFGIKQKDNEAAVVFNTWEVYNGVRYNIDANFRAYANMEESWKDYNKFLMEGPRYQPLRDVMYDSTQGAWALRRAGYATDPQYPIKLMNIIKQYNLKDLDKVKI